MNKPRASQLHRHAAKAGLKVIHIRYRNQVGQYLHGFDVVTQDGYILYSIEPVHYSNGDRWMIHNNNDDTKPGIMYRKNLYNILNGLDLTARPTGYMLAT